MAFAKKDVKPNTRFWVILGENSYGPQVAAGTNGRTAYYESPEEAQKAAGEILGQSRRTHVQIAEVIAVAKTKETPVEVNIVKDNA